MANFDSLFSVGIGADISILQTELQKAKNLLSQFEAAAKKATDIGQINYLNGQISGLKNTISSLGTEMNKAGKPIGDASQSLINFSRIAQDAPYGIQGIANNLNPMVESFQRLAKTEGGTKNALKAMLEGLTGPAGLGVAIGLVSSLAVTFSKEISNFFSGPTEELKKFREELNKLNLDLYKIAGASQANRTKGINLIDEIVGGNKTQQEQALKELKKLYSSSAEIKAAKITDDKAYLTHLVNMASIQDFVNGKEKNNVDALTLAYENQKLLKKKIKAETDAAKTTTEQVGTDVIITTTRDEKIIAINKKYAVELAKINADILRLTKENKGLVSELTSFKTPDEKGGNLKDKVSEIQKALQSLNEVMNTEGAKLLSGRISEKGAKDSYAVVVLESIYKTIDKISGSKSKEALDAVKKLIGTANELEEKYYGKQPTAPKSGLTTEGVFKAEPDLSKGTGEKQLDSLRTARQLAMFNKEQIVLNFEASRKAAKANEKILEEQKKSYEDFAMSVSQNVVGALSGMYQAMQQGDSFGKAFGDMLSRIVEQLIMVAAQAAIFSLIMQSLGMPVGGAGGGFMSIFTSLLGIPKHAAGGITTGPSVGMIGEAGPEAIMPLSKLGNFLNTSFNAGAMSGGNSSNGGTFTLRGQDLLLSVNRAQKASNLKGQNISLA